MLIKAGHIELCYSDVPVPITLDAGCTSPCPGPGHTSAASAGPDEAQQCTPPCSEWRRERVTKREGEGRKGYGRSGRREGGEIKGWKKRRREREKGEGKERVRGQLESA